MARNFPAPQPTQVKLSGVTWREHYGCYSAKVADWLNLSFAYGLDHSRGSDEPPYKVTVGDRTLKLRAPDPPTAAALAVKVAKVLLKKAVDELEAL